MTIRSARSRQRAGLSYWRRRGPPGMPRSRNVPECRQPLNHRIIVSFSRVFAFRDRLVRGPFRTAVLAPNRHIDVNDLQGCPKPAPRLNANGSACSAASDPSSGTRIERYMSSSANLSLGFRRSRIIKAAAARTVSDLRARRLCAAGRRC